MADAPRGAPGDGGPEPVDPKGETGSVLTPTRPAPAPASGPVPLSDAVLPAGGDDDGPIPAVPNFQVLKKLGQGGQGTVWLAESLDGLGKRCALKLFPREAKGAYARELEAWRRVEEIRRHTGTPHLVEGYAAGHTPDGQAYVAMAFCDQGSLADRLASGGPIPTPLAVKFARHVLAALELLHQHGLFHRDVKPQNVLIGNDGIARLADYGLSKRLGASVTGSCTPAFAAPEQLAGEAGADGVKIDIYGVAATLFALLTGKPPVPGRPDVFLLERMKVPRAVHAPLLRALNPDPELRPARAAELAQALAQAEPRSSHAGIATELDSAAPAFDGQAVPASEANTRAQPHADVPPPADELALGGKLAGATTATRGRNAAGSRALLVLAAGLAAVAFASDLFRDHPPVVDGIAVVRSGAVDGVPSRATTGDPDATPHLAWHAGPVPLAGLRMVSSAPGLVALLGSRTTWLAGPDGVLAVPTGGRLAAPWGARRVLLASSRELSFEGSGASVVVPVAGTGRITALAAHAGVRRVAVARAGSAPLLLAIDRDERVARAAPLAPSGPTAGEAAPTTLALAFDEPGTRLAVAAVDPGGAGRISIYDVKEDPRLLTVLDASGPTALAWLGPEALAVGSVHGSVVVLDPRDGSLARTIAVFEGEVAALALSPSRRFLVVAGDERRLVPLAEAPSDAIVVTDPSGARLAFPRRPELRLVAFAAGELAARGPIAPAFSSGSFDPEALR